MVDRESVITPPKHNWQLPLLLPRIFVAVTSWSAFQRTPSAARQLLSQPHYAVWRFLLLLQLLVMVSGVTSITDLPRSSAAAAQTAPSPDGRRPSPNSERETVEKLVKRWAPLVWLAPGEMFMPGNVNDFLRHVHAQKSTPAAASLMHQTADILDVSDDVLLYELDREIGVTERTAAAAVNEREHRTKPGNNQQEKQPAPSAAPLDRRERRISFSDRVIDLPIGKRSVDWYLVSNEDIDSELLNTSSFLYGRDPNEGGVPIYSVISMCQSPEQPSTANDIDSVDRIDRVPYIPLRADGFPYKFETPTIDTHLRPAIIPRRFISRTRRDIFLDIQTSNKSNKIISSKNESINMSSRLKPPIVPKKRPTTKIPHFHVTYWMFYPYNQGKTICTLNLGPFGRLPIPVLFGQCLGTRRDFGSHVGDWEHMTLFFKGRAEPDEMYVSAHDAGAYYTYERLSGSFEFRRQETRNNGILQHPNFPKTVRTISDHPVLFSAQGSHGLWTAPGRHRFVRVPKLVDINGFGIPWYTWKNIEFSYDRRDRSSRDSRKATMIGPDWLQYMGKWGNPKSKCHPLKRLGLNFCEYNDGPTGIPMKEPHFFCKWPR